MKANMKLSRSRMRPTLALLLLSVAISSVGALASPLLPTAGDSTQYPREELYPTLQVSFSVHNFNPDTKGLAQTVGSDVSFGALLSVGVEVSFSQIIGIQAEGGSTAGGNEALQAFLGPVFYPPFLNSVVKPFVGAGFTMTSIRASGNDLTVKAGSKGWYVSAGLQYILGTAAGMSLYGTYSGLGKVSTTYTATYVPPPGQPVHVPASIDFRHMAIGFRLTFFL